MCTSRWAAAADAAREFGVDLITTVPNVEYRLVMTSGDVERLENPSAMPDRTRIERIEEPYVRSRIVVPAEYIGGVQKLCFNRRGEFHGMHYLDPTRVEFTYELRSFPQQIWVRRSEIAGDGSRRITVEVPRHG